MRTELNLGERRRATDDLSRSKDSALMAQHSVLCFALCFFAAVMSKVEVSKI